MDFVPSSEAKPGEEVASGGLHPPYIGERTEISVVPVTIGALVF
jgi:hypothetical protein